MTQSVFASYRAKKFANAQESLGQAAQELHTLVNEINTLDETSLDELAKRMPEYGKIRQYIEKNIQEGHPIDVQGIEGEEGLPLFFKAVLLTKIRELQAKTERRLEESTSREELAELTGVAKQLNNLENLIYENLKVIRRVQKYDTRNKNTDSDEVHGANIYKLLEQFLKEKGKRTKEELTEQEQQEFINDYYPREKRKMTGKKVPLESTRKLDEITRHFEDALSLVETASDEISSYEGFFSEIEQEAMSTGFVTAYRQISVPAGKKLEEVLAAKGDSIGRVWYKTEESAPPSEAGDIPNTRVDTYHLEARIPKDSIDWKVMKQLYSSEMGPNSQAVIGEIYAVKGAPIGLTRIFKVTAEGDEMEIPVGKSTVRAEDISDCVRIAETKFAAYVANNKPQGPVTEDRKPATESAAGASPLTHGDAEEKVPPSLTAKIVNRVKSRFGW